MKSLYPSTSVLKTSSQRLVKACALVSVLAAGAMPAVQAAPTVQDFGTFSMGPTSKANLTNGAMIVRTSPFATIRGYVATGFAGGLWNGFGINSSTAATDPNGITALGIANNADFGLATFFGHPTTGGTESLIRYTYYGDATLDGKVNADDYAFTDAGFAGGANYWGLGDFNYDGVVDATDYAFLDAGFAGQGAPFAPSLTGGGGKPAGVVPEPSALGMMLVGALGLLQRRRR